MRRGYSLMELVLALGVVTVAVLALITVFISGLELSARSRDLATATELARAVMERTKLNLRTAGFAYVPAGSYTFDGRAPAPRVGAPPLDFPPDPYPGVPNLNGQRYSVLVTGSEPNPGKLKEMRVEVLFGPSSRVVVETRFHP